MLREIQSPDPVLAREARERLDNHFHAQEEWLQSETARINARDPEATLGRRVEAGSIDPSDPTFYRRAAALAEKPDDQLTFEEAHELIRARERIARGVYTRESERKARVPRLVPESAPPVLTTGEGASVSGLPGGYTVIPEHYAWEATNPYGTVTEYTRRLEPPKLIGYPEDPGGPYGALVSGGRTTHPDVARAIEQGGGISDAERWRILQRYSGREAEREARIAPVIEKVKEINRNIQAADDDISSTLTALHRLNAEAEARLREGVSGVQDLGLAQNAEAREIAQARLLGLRFQRKALEEQRRGVVEHHGGVRTQLDMHRSGCSSMKETSDLEGRDGRSAGSSIALPGCHGILSAADPGPREAGQGR